MEQRNEERMKTSPYLRGGFRNSLNTERGLFQDGAFGQGTKFSRKAGKSDENTMKYYEIPQ